MKKIVPPLILITILVLGILYGPPYYRKLYPPANPNIIQMSGYIETREYDVSFQIPGKIKDILVDEGDAVRKGQLLSTLDQDDLLRQRGQSEDALVVATTQIPQMLTRISMTQSTYSAQLSQSHGALAEARTRLRQLLNGSRKEEIAQADFQTMQAKSSMNLAKKDYERAKMLFEKGAIGAQSRDQAFTQYEVAKDSYRRLNEARILVKKGPREEEIQAARDRLRQANAAVEVVKASELQVPLLKEQTRTIEAQIEQARSSIAIIDTQLSHTRLYSPIDGVVLTRVHQPREVVPAAGTVMTLGNIVKLWFRGYINETDLGKVKLGQKVEVKSDSYPDRVYEGTISFISSEAEFTPKNLQTKEDRVKLVYRIKVDIDNPRMELKPGMICDATIDLRK